MENASKALIIAGAILISILLISVGVLIMNSTDSVTKGVGEQSDSMAIQQFNAQFTSYEGNGKSASQIRSLFNAMYSSNATREEQVSIVAGKDTKKTYITSGDQVIANQKYTVVLNYDTTTGLVNTINIVQE